VLAAFALVAASPARAQGAGAPSSPAYLLARLGAFVPQHSDLDQFRSGFDGELGVGYRFNPNLALEGALGYYKSSTPDVTLFDPGSGLTFTGNATLSVVPLTATMRAILPVDRVELSVLGGFGLYFATMEATASVPGIGSASQSYSDSPLGVHLGTGASVLLTPSASLGAELRYVWARATFNGSSGQIDGLRMDAMLAYRF
jgi:opacity protein-like surface antigen